jgi:MEMO1 family protein
MHVFRSRAPLVVLGLVASMVISALVVLVIQALAYCSGNRDRASALQPAPQEKPPAAGAATQDRPAPPRKVLVSPLAGRWYPAGRAALTAAIQDSLKQAKTGRLAHVQALILPHAGYRFSGPVAAYGLKALSGQAFRRVIVLGPSHRLRMTNMASIPDATHIRTPLGEVPLDLEFIATLKRHSFFRTVSAAHHGEHSVQIEIPLLQATLHDFRLVPIVVGQLDLATVKAMARALTGLIDPETLVVVSSDFTHFGPNYDYQPFRDDVTANLKKLDLGAVARIEARDAQGFLDYVQKTGATICGRCPIAVLLAMLPDTSRVHLLRYDTSASITGDPENSVSYLAVAVTGKWEEKPAVNPNESKTALGPEDRARLLRLARAAIAYALEHRRAPQADALGETLTEPLRARRAAFVTLRKKGELRGCIGEILPSQPLHESVVENAVNAAFNDRRFSPLAASELKEIEIDISALTPPEEVDSYEKIQVGRHGVVLAKNGRRSVFLPQVAPEQGWDRATMLEHLARKAGLPGDAWKSGATFLVFEAEVFGESKE